MVHNFFLSELQPVVLLLLLTYLATLLLVLVAFVPGASENLVRFLVGLKQVVRFENGAYKHKAGKNAELIFALRKFFGDARIPLVIRLLFLLIILGYVVSKLFINL